MPARLCVGRARDPRGELLPLRLEEALEGRGCCAVRREGGARCGDGAYEVHASKLATAGIGSRWVGTWWVSLTTYLEEVHLQRGEQLARPSAGLRGRRCLAVPERQLQRDRLAVDGHHHRDHRRLQHAM